MGKNKIKAFCKWESWRIFYKIYRMLVYSCDNFGIKINIKVGMQK